jgi:DNA topoisomerase IB
VKFDRMVEFGETLPKLRQRLRRDLALPGLPRDKVLAVIVTLLDTTRIRIGNEEYARTNKSFGLTTLRDRHVQFVRDGRAMFKFRGKSGAVHEVVLNDRRLARIVRSCQELPGQQLFQYIGDDGQQHPVDSDQVNQYLKEAMGADFTAKDFRTWGATLHAIALMARIPLPENAKERVLKSHITNAIKEVAKELRNTPAVCRKSYINPVVFTAWRCGKLHKIVRETVQPASRQAEVVALRFLRAVAKSPDLGIPIKQVRKAAVERATKRLVKALERAGQLDAIVKPGDTSPPDSH